MNPFLAQLAGSGLGIYANLLARTVRVQLVGEENLLGPLVGTRPVVFAAWHGQTHLLFPLIKGRLDLSRMVLIVVDDERSLTLQGFAQAVGVQAFPVGMEDDTMAGARHLLRLIRLLRSGKMTYVTPDGPDGPSGVPKPGVAYIAQLAGAWVVPLGTYIRNAFRLRRWDRYALPMPYSQVTVAVRPPIAASRVDEREDLLDRLTVELDAAMEDARLAAGTLSES